ncbi:MAG: hypothetical protein IBX72_04565 [Nitrospirae bacterium]|nr:hypothetical protein [Nitrospirota bacterium]
MLGTETLIETEKEINLLRGMSYIFDIFLYLQDEPFCSRCDSFVKSIETAKGKFLILENSINKKRDIPEELRKLLLSIYRAFADITIPDNPVRQKEEGTCKLPPGVCFAESALAFYERIEA